MERHRDFEIDAKFQPAGDQPQAIDEVVESLEQGNKHHTLLGVTGSGKTFSIAHIIARCNRSALVIAPNKTLAAQLYVELKGLFPRNAVGFFISFYDYYQPEAYVPSTDTYIAKDSAINEDIDRMRHDATQQLFEEQAVIIVASVSCIYGLGSPEAYSKHVAVLKVGDRLSRRELLTKLVDIQYQRNDHNLLRGHFRVRGDLIDILPSNANETAVRVELSGKQIASINTVDAITGAIKTSLEEISVYPNSHYVSDRKEMRPIIDSILEDLGLALRKQRAANRLVEAQRLEQRTMHDVETIEQLGYCPGIENYSRYLTGKAPGEAPPCLLDYFPPDYLTIIDESHITIPQLRGMYRGDQARKKTLVEYGFRLLSALDNRPLNFDEFTSRCNQVVYVSATPGPYELDISAAHVSEQIIRPTGLVDPPIHVRPARQQVDDLLSATKLAVNNGGRVLITTLTKKMAEDLSEYYSELDLKVRYLHADVDALERANLLRDLRIGVYDVLIGINLLREGLDLPEVQLVAVMDADKEGFLRSHRSLIQIVGRAARNHQAQVIFYADRVTESMRLAIDETERRRSKQMDYNSARGIVPRTVVKEIPKDLRTIVGIADDKDEGSASKERLEALAAQYKSAAAVEKEIRRRVKTMKSHAGRMEFEQAAKCRDEVRELKALLMVLGEERS